MNLKLLILSVLVYKLNAMEFVDFTCNLIRHIQMDEYCQKVIYNSCGHCLGSIPKNKGIRVLGFPEKEVSNG